MSEHITQQARNEHVSWYYSLQTCMQHPVVKVHVLPSQGCMISLHFKL